MRYKAWITAVLGVVLSVACSGSAGDADTQAAPADTQHAAMADMPGMGGASSTVDRLMAVMDTALRRTEGATGDSLVSLLPSHRQTLANLISEMNAEMRGMSMTADAAWTSVVDSLRQDLVTLPELDGDELRQVMPAHRKRVERLMEMHRAMMRNMQK